MYAFLVSYRLKNTDKHIYDENTKIFLSLDRAMTYTIGLNKSVDMEKGHYEVRDTAFCDLPADTAPTPYASSSLA